MIGKFINKWYDYKPIIIIDEEMNSKCLSPLSTLLKSTTKVISLKRVESSCVCTIFQILSMKTTTWNWPQSEITIRNLSFIPIWMDLEVLISNSHRGLLLFSHFIQEITLRFNKLLLEVLEEPMKHVEVYWSLSKIPSKRFNLLMLILLFPCLKIVWMLTVKMFKPKLKSWDHFTRIKR